MQKIYLRYRDDHDGNFLEKFSHFDMITTSVLGVLIQLFEDSD